MRALTAGQPGNSHDNSYDLINPFLVAFPVASPLGSNIRVPSALFSAPGPQRESPLLESSEAAEAASDYVREAVPLVTNCELSTNSK